ncbi:transglutaminase family protein [soil metagenome]
MKFELTHTSVHDYAHPAAEAYGEARLTPPDTDRQTVSARKLILEPRAELSTYTDIRGNVVEFFSLPYRHESLTITHQATVKTAPQNLLQPSLDLSLGETRQILRSAIVDIFDYLQPTQVVARSSYAQRWARRHLADRRPLGEALGELNSAIYKKFTYKSGATSNRTPLSTVWRSMTGVCQDFAHIMLAVLRCGGLPCRYVCGYIEAAPPTIGARGEVLVGAVATHAWVEILVPGMTWVAYDPTNNKLCGEQHITCSYGVDAREAAPFRGTLKGTGGQTLKVDVRVKRLEPLPPRRPAPASPKSKRKPSRPKAKAKSQSSNG